MVLVYAHISYDYLIVTTLLVFSNIQIGKVSITKINNFYSPTIVVELEIKQK